MTGWTKVKAGHYRHDETGVEIKLAGIIEVRRRAIAAAYDEAEAEDAYRTELRTELAKFAKGEPPYSYDGWEIVTAAAAEVNRRGASNAVAHGEMAAAVEAMQLGEPDRAISAARYAVALLEPVVRLGVLDNGAAVDAILDKATELEWTYEEVEAEIMRVTGCTEEGAYTLVFAGSVAALADEGR